MKGDGSGVLLPEPLRGISSLVLGTWDAYATTLRRHSLTHPTRNTIQMFRGENLAELCLWISARCFRESGAGNSAWPELEPAGHRSAARHRRGVIICAVWKGCWRDRVARIATAFDFAVPLRQFLAH